MTENALREKKREKNPTPFTAEELARISAKLEVRAEYLLMGAEPICDEVEIPSADAKPPQLLSEALYEHILRVVGARFEASRQGVASYLPGPTDLLVAIEHAVGDAFDENFHRGVEHRLSVSRAVRLATRDKWEPTGPTPEAFQELIRQLMKSPPKLSPKVADAAAEAGQEDDQLQPSPDLKVQSAAIKEASAKERKRLSAEQARESHGSPPET